MSNRNMYRCNFGHLAPTSRTIAVEFTSDCDLPVVHYDLCDVHADQALATRLSGDVRNKRLRRALGLDEDCSRAVKHYDVIGSYRS